jgi:hypothetical protein
MMNAIEKALNDMGIKENMTKTEKWQIAGKHDKDAINYDMQPNKKKMRKIIA